MVEFNGTGYNATYTADDVDDIAVDFVGTYGVQLISLAGLIALVVIGVWFFKQSKKFK